MIKELQRIIHVPETGILDERTIDKATHMSNEMGVITWLQKFLNSLDHEFKVGRVKKIDDSSYLAILSGEMDRGTRELLTYFQKEYWEYKRIPVTAKLDRPTWELIAAYLNK